jgi:hypothetical protein
VRGRSERTNRTLQDRLVNELRVARHPHGRRRNRYLQARFLPAFNAEFAHPSADPTSAFIRALSGPLHPAGPAGCEPLSCSPGDYFTVSNSCGQITYQL